MIASTEVRMKKNIISYIIVIIAVCIGGEFQFYPLNDNVRISFGTPVFFFFLLWSKTLRPIQAGALVGVSVVLFRSILSILEMEHLTWAQMLHFHSHVFFYYFTYGLFFYLLKTRKYYHRPIIIALNGMIIEIISNITSVSFRYLILGELVTSETLITMLIFSFIRSFFVLGFFNFFLLREASATEAIYKQKNEDMLLLISNLYIEQVQLKKSMKNSENTTKLCYDLYSNLLKERNHYAKDALHIAGEIHEIKKDHQRIYSGLAKLQVKEHSTEFIKIEEIIEVVIEGNQRYAKMLGKSILFEKNILGEHPEYNCFIVLSIINNLITNSIEAIEASGKISIIVERIGQEVRFQIEDNGPGIPPNKQLLVFEPGYTTKYNSNGGQSTGIGLSHVKEVIEALKGQIQLTSNEEIQKTTFVITLPVNSIINMR